MQICFNREWWSAAFIGHLKNGTSKLGQVWVHISEAIRFGNINLSLVIRSWIIDLYPWCTYYLRGSSSKDPNQIGGREENIFFWKTVLVCMFSDHLPKANFSWIGIEKPWLHLCCTLFQTEATGQTRVQNSTRVDWNIVSILGLWLKITTIPQSLYLCVLAQWS